MNYKFGPFELDAQTNTLLRGTATTMLGQRATALLGVLLEYAGRPVSKATLIEAAWPGLSIEDSNLTVQIAALRRVLGREDGGSRWIETLPRRGYRYVGPAVETHRSTAEPSAEISPPLAPRGKPSIAILPFINMSGDPGQNYFVDGMVEDIAAGLSRIKGLFVIAPSSSFTLQDIAEDAQRVGRQLGVRYLLRGSLHKDQNRVRITARMIEAETGVHVWSERYERRLDSIFALQDEITLAIVGAIEPGLRRAEADRVKRIRPDSLDAYDLVLQAQPDINSAKPERAKKALVLLERALVLEPNYALAHAFAAMCHHCLFLRGGQSEDDRAASLRHARAAISHGQDDALALALAGFSLGMDGRDRAAAFAAFDAALAINPSSALAYIFGSTILVWAGESERAMEWAERGMRLSPFDPFRFGALNAQVLGYFQGGRYAEAADAAYKAVQANPEHSISYMLLAAVLVKLGRTEEAKEAGARVVELQPGFRYSRQLSGLDCATTLAASLGEALRDTGLPE